MKLLRLLIALEGIVLFSGCGSKTAPQAPLQVQPAAESSSIRLPVLEFDDGQPSRKPDLIVSIRLTDASEPANPVVTIGNQPIPYQDWNSKLPQAIRKELKNSRVQVKEANVAVLADASLPVQQLLEALKPLTDEGLCHFMFRVSISRNGSSRWGSVHLTHQKNIAPSAEPSQYSLPPFIVVMKTNQDREIAELSLNDRTFASVKQLQQQIISIFGDGPDFWDEGSLVLQVDPNFRYGELLRCAVAFRHLRDSDGRIRRQLKQWSIACRTKDKNAFALGNARPERKIEDERKGDQIPPVDLLTFPDDPSKQDAFPLEVLEKLGPEGTEDEPPKGRITPELEKELLETIERNRRK